jgi:hypothetical protein
MPGLRNSAALVACRCSHAQDGPPQCRQGDSVSTVIDQRPVYGTVITQPVVLYTALLLAGTNKRRRGSFSRFVHTVRLHQKQLAISEPEEGFAILGIGASAEHILVAFCPAKNHLGQPLGAELLALRLPRDLHSAR